MPLANKFLREDELKLPEHFFPLNVYFCNDCGLVQLVNIVDKETLFSEYAYFSSGSKTFVNHSERLAEEIVSRFLPKSGSLVVEIGSNDGVLLKPLNLLKSRTLGVEPASNVAKVARGAGIETLDVFFTEQLAKHILEEKGPAEVIVCCNVFNHIDDLDSVMKGIDLLLNKDGVLVIEVPYLIDLIERNAFDTMYHEMHSYFAVKPLMRLFQKFGMEIFDVKRFDLHGGSIRVYVRRTKSGSIISDSVRTLISIEDQMKLDSYETSLKFAAEIQALKDMLVNLLRDLKSHGKTIVGYGAPAKGNILLNYCKIGTDILDYIVDVTPYKQGLYTPGMHIPVRPIEAFKQDSPDYALLLPWNFANEILQREQQYRDAGGKFIIPLPKPKVV